MLIKDLIKLLEEEYKEQDRYSDMMGEPEIMIDIFDIDENHNIRYKGFSPNVTITSSSDGVYRILTAFSTEENSNKNTST